MKSKKHSRMEKRPEANKELIINLRSINRDQTKRELKYLNKDWRNILDLKIAYSIIQLRSVI